MRRVRPGRGDLCCRWLFSQQTNASGEARAKDRYSREGDKEARVAREEIAPTNNQEDFRKPGMSLVQDSGGRNGLYGSSRQL